MSVTIRMEKGINKPVIICDHCGQRIDDAREGIYQWQVDDRGRPVGEGVMRFTHNDCCRSFETAHGGRRAWCWGPLSCLPVFLLRNLRLDWEKAKENAELMSCV